MYIRNVIKFFLRVFLAISILAAIFLVYVNLPVKSKNENSKLGVTFSGLYASQIKMDWKETFIALLDDLKVKKIRIPIYWNLVEKEDGIYDFSDLDWQLNEASKRNAEIILVVGQKVPRWPECYIPEWLKNDNEKRKEKLLSFIKIAVERYRDREVVKYWQVENEPFLNFGVCPELDKKLLDQEIALVKKEDPSKKIIITDSGELSFWIQAAKRADIFGTTLYRTIWKEGFGYFDYPIGPRFFQAKAWLIKILANQKNNIVVELQGEPWINGWTVDGTLEEQFNSMNPQKLKENIEFAQKVGFPEIYVWGVEWWYWLKTQKNHPEMWETAKDFFN